MLQLRDLYHREASITEPNHCQTLAIGDGDNDVAMLEVASSALVIRADNRSPPILKRSHDCYTSEQIGPLGWVEGVSLWLEKSNKYSN
jgi:predicted mannosyl-3-phosphoglycerate phosphatase (HAD superfamily)